MENKCFLIKCVFKFRIPTKMKEWHSDTWIMGVYQNRTIAGETRLNLMIEAEKDPIAFAEKYFYFEKSIYRKEFLVDDIFDTDSLWNSVSGLTPRIYSNATKSKIVLGTKPEEIVDNIRMAFSVVPLPFGEIINYCATINND